MRVFNRADIRRNWKWKELINLKKDKEAKYTVSVQEWRQPADVELLQEEETRDVILFPHKQVNNVEV